MTQFSRRAFLQTAAAGAAALVAGPGVPVGAARKKIPFGVQLYSVRQLMAKDVPGTLAGVRKVGFEGVEFAGYFNYSAKDMRKLLDDNGLKCCGTHTALKTLQGDELLKTVEYNQIIGNRLLIVPSLPPLKTIDAWIQMAATFSEITDRLKSHKMQVGYHNHTVEFQTMEGKIPMEAFMSKSKKAVFAQLDIGHCKRAGGDPTAFIKKFPGRVLSVHVKEFSPTKKDAVPGEGEVKWAEVLKACEGPGKTEWYVIEEESGAYQGFDGIDRSLQGLKKLLA